MCARRWQFWIGWMRLKLGNRFFPTCLPLRKRRTSDKTLRLYTQTTFTSKLKGNQMQFQLCNRSSFAVMLYLAFSVQAPVWAQADEKLCQLAMKPVVSGLTLHWDSFNMFNNRKETYSETGFAQAGEGRSCKIKSQRSSFTSPDRPCTWTSRLSCDLQLNKDPISHNFSSGSYQYGKLQWVGNEKLTVNVKRGETSTPETREVAVVKFVGLWSSGNSRGDSISTVYFDRDWGVLLKAEGAHDANKWGDTVTLIEVKP